MRDRPVAEVRNAARTHMAGSARMGIGMGATWRFSRGHAHGLRGPLLSGSIAWPAKGRWDESALTALLCDAGGLAPAEVERCLAGGVGIDAFLAVLRALEVAAYSPVMQAGVQVAPAVAREDKVHHSVAVPTFVRRFTRSLVEWVITAINVCDLDLPGERRSAIARTLGAQLDEANAAFRADTKSFGVNTVRIARACCELDLPLRWLPRGFLHVGSGSWARMFHSTMTESTPSLAVTIARSKSQTVSLLSQHGMPVPKHQLVGSAQEAVDAALKLGFPVVVKPDDQDGGRGVNAGLATEDQVRQAYEQAAAISRYVLVETHVEGDDFRITVENGRVVKAIGRRPGGVLGDGRRTVEELVKEAAAAMPGGRARRTTFGVDDEALALLAGRGMTVGSVPPAGEFIVLRRRANLSTGGTSRDVLPELHPDNARLAVRAARALRLDVAGIDLIIPDVSVSWMECKAAICEVNAQPQISTEFAPDVYTDLLRRMVPPPGRLHAVLLLDASGAPDCDAAVAEAAQRLQQSGQRVLSVRSDGTRLGEERLAPPVRDAFSAAMGAELETEATAVVAALTPAQVLHHGSPWLHVDEVRVLRGSAPLQVPSLRACLQLLAPHLQGEPVLDAETARLLA